jgi:hypothetical protein
VATNRENVLAGVGRTAVNARRTHCKYGHPFDEENTYVNKYGQRCCRLCRARRSRAWGKRRRQVLPETQRFALQELERSTKPGLLSSSGTFVAGERVWINRTVQQRLESRGFVEVRDDGAIDITEEGRAVLKVRTDLPEEEQG